MSAWEARGRSDDWYTPAWIFDGLGCEFDLDVAAPPFPERIHVPCHARICAASLSLPWRNCFVWMNPPFGGRNGIKPWLDKFFKHGNGIALMPDRTSAPWFQEAAWKASAILFVCPKIKFERPDGTPGKSPGCGTALMSAGMHGRSVLYRAGKLGVVVLPNTAAAPGTSGDAQDGKGAG